MAPSTSPHIIAQLRHLVYYNLDNNLLKNALFVAGRLQAYDQKSAEAAYLLALCQHLSGLSKSAWETSRHHIRRGTHLGCAYVYAQTCLELGLYADGISALNGTKALWLNKNHWNQHNENRRQHLPDAAAVWCLMGKLWKAHKNTEEAVKCWASSLRINPFMWDAFMGLCDSGAKINVSAIYNISPEMMAVMRSSQKSDNVTQTIPEKPHTSTHPQTIHTTQSDPFMSTQSKANALHVNTVLGEKHNISKTSVNTVSTILDEEEDMSTPSTLMDMDESQIRNLPVKHVDEPPPAPVRKIKSAQEVPAWQAPPPKMRTASLKNRFRSKLGGSEEATVHQDPPPPSAPPTKRTVSGQVAASSVTQNAGSEAQRRSNRLANNSRPTTATGISTFPTVKHITNFLGLRETSRDIKKPKVPLLRGRIATTATVGRVVSGNRTRLGSSDNMDVDGKTARYPVQAIPPVPMIPVQKIRHQAPLEKDLEALRTVLDWFKRLSTAQLALTGYDCQAAIQAYNSLPSHQRETAYVWSQIGKAYYEEASYHEAERYFQRVRDAAPARLEDMEVYSTILWHLKSEIDLAYLGHQLIQTNRLSPQAWCAIGNSFSLQREHEQALKCFRRATQLDPLFAYGFTLQGHEYITNEEFEKALEAYRCAIAADNRHYNAWYGLGKVYEKMGKWDVAEQHYKTAARINPSNAVLTCCIGVVLERLKQPEAALQMYSRAVALQPNSALSRFKKAKCLMALARSSEALGELEILKDMAPDEANVHFLLGRLYKMLGRRGEAVKAFTMALNLDPKVCPDPSLFSFPQNLTLTACNRPHNSSKTPWSLWTTKTWTVTTPVTTTTAMTAWIKENLPRYSHRPALQPIFTMAWRSIA